MTLLSDNRIEIMAAKYAANLLGARTTFLYNGLAAAVQATIVAAVDTDVLVVDTVLAERAAAVLERAPVATVLGLGPTGVGEDMLALADKVCSTWPAMREVQAQCKALPHRTRIWGTSHPRHRCGRRSGHPGGSHVDL